MKYPQEKFSDLQNTLKKTVWNYELPTIKNFKPTKYPPEKIVDKQNTLKKKFHNHEIPTIKKFKPTNNTQEKFWTNKIHLGLNLEIMKYK